MLTSDGADEELVLGSTRRRRDVRPRAWVLVIVAAVLAGVGAWYVFRPAHQLAVTYGGSRVDNAAQVIRQADAAFTGYTRAHSGSLSARSRCYFDRVGGTSRTDVSTTVYCGPVLFYRDSPPALYLRFALSTIGAGRSAGHVDLQAAAGPLGGPTVVIPDRAALERPDGRTPPRGADGLTAPGPPPAAVGLLAGVASVDLPRLPALPKAAVIGSRDLEVDLLATGFVNYYGLPAVRRTAPPGERLLAVELRFTDGELPYAQATGAVRIGVSIDDGLTRALPVLIFSDALGSLDNTDYFVVAIPVHARSADLVVTDASITQRMSLLTGAPAADNVAILRRPFASRLYEVSAGGAVVATVSLPGRATFTADLPVHVYREYFGYFSRSGTSRASGPMRALLYVYACFGVQLAGCIDFGAPLMSIKPDGGPAIPARTYSGDPAFDVPASFTTGILTISGAGSFEGISMRIDTPFHTRITLRH